MANWGNTKISKDDGVKVVSHERILDTNPETYRRRGALMLQQENYPEAERAYLQAMKWAGVNDADLKELLVVYYKSEDRVMVAKADAMFDDWWWRQGESKLQFYGLLCGCSFMLAFCGMSGQFAVGLMMAVFLGGFISYCYPPNKVFAANARIDWGYFRRKIAKSLAPFLLLILIAVLDAISLNGIIPEKVLHIGDAIASASLVQLVGKVIGIVLAVVCLYAFHRGVSVMQEGVSRWETAFLRKFFGRLLTIARIVCTFAMLGLSYMALSEGWMPFVS